MSQISHVHLHTHSRYSLLDGVSSVEDLVKRAKDFGAPAIAITEHGNLMSEYELYEAALKYGIKPIMGIETYIINSFAFTMNAKKDVFDKNDLKNEPSFSHFKTAFNNYGYAKKHHHLLLLAANQRGVENIRKLTSFSHRSGFYFRPSVTHAILKKYNDGVFSSTGCMAGEIPSLIQIGMYKEAEDLLLYYLDVFKGRYFIEFQRHDIPELEKINSILLQFAIKYKVPAVATGDIHYLNKNDKQIQDILLKIAQLSHSSNKVTVVEDDISFNIKGDGYHYQSPEEMAERFSIFGDEGKRMLENSVAIANEINYETTICNEFQMPEINKEQSEEEKISLFRKRVYEGAKKRYGENLSPHLIERIEYEIGVITKMGFVDYFEILADIISYISSKNEIWNVRGSGSGSIVLYCLFISHVDPVYHSLIFERFLNPNRVSLPDVDIDVSDTFRQNIANYLQKKYGTGHVARILTHGTMKLKLAFRDVCRIYEISPQNINIISKKIPEHFTTVDELENDAAFMNMFKTFKNYKEILDAVRQITNKTRQVGVHPAGIIVSPKPIESYTAFHRETKTAKIEGDNDESYVYVEEDGDELNTNHEEILPVQLDMANAEMAKLVKFDILGVRSLRIIAKTLEEIKKRHNKDISFTEIPTDYNDAYDHIYHTGDTVGVFQISSSQMRAIMMRLKPTSIFHIVAIIALYRPGPLQFIEEYVERKLGKDFSYFHEKLEPILKETFGIFVYQEQVMQAVVSLAGFSKAEADILRKAMSKKDAKKMAAYRQQFVEGCVKISGIDPEESGKLWDKGIVPFAGYGFNKAHASSYAEISAKTAWLKYYYRKEFLVSCLNSEMERPDKVSLYIGDARKSGIKILPPNINLSEKIFIIDQTRDNAFRFGLGALKHTKKETINAILKERNANGTFLSLKDLFARVPKIDKKTFGVLLLSGALDCLYQEDDTKDAGIAVREKIFNELSDSYKKSIQKLFEQGITKGQIPKNKFEWLVSETITTGDVYLTKHPIVVYFDLHKEILSKREFIIPDFIDLKMPEKSERFTVGIIKDSPYYDPKKQILFVDLYGINGFAIKMAAFASDAENFSKLLSENILIKAKIYRTARGYYLKNLAVLGKITEPSTYL